MKDFKFSGFFALRTPLLPFDELLAWSEGLQASASLDNPTLLELMVAQDRALLRTRLRQIMSRAEVREAVFVASPHLDEAFDIWVREPDSERGQGIERALVRYFVRMAGRATPFGLCAGCSVGVPGAETHLVIAERAKYRRHTRIAMDYLFALSEAMRNDSALRKIFTYRPNTSLYRAAGRTRYVGSRLKDKERSFHLILVEDTDYLAATLSRAENGAGFESLAAALVDDDVTLEDAEAYINELVDSQILVADIPLCVTGLEPVHRLIEHLRQLPQTRSVAEKLDQTGAEFAAMDSAGLGIAPARYRAALSLLEGLPAEPELAYAFQADMIKPASQATLGKAVLAEMARGVDLLHRMQSPRGPDELTRFREGFLARYEMKEVPLLEALDEEDGVGFGLGSDTSPLLESIYFPPTPDETKVWGARERLLLQKLSEALQSGAHEIVLTREDVDEMAGLNPPPLPAAFAVIATVVASSEAGLVRGDFRVILEGATGPSGVPWLGRFCYADEVLRQHVERTVREENTRQPGVVFAEIVHLPEAHFGFACRPALSDYEIPYLGSASVASSQQIAVANLTVSVRGDRIILYSKNLGCEVIPRMSNAHDHRRSTLGVYRFLCALQHQGAGEGVGWDWGALREAPFLPRVVTGRLVLRRAQWRINEKEVKRLRGGDGTALFKTVQVWRAERRLPRWVAIADGDNVWPVDLDNVLSVETFVHLVRNREEATLTEVFPGPDELCACGPEGRFVHELVVPFMRTSETGRLSGEHTGESANNQSASPSLANHSFPHTRARTFPPGSEWLYAKLYMGSTTADHVLCEFVAPLVRDILDGGAVDHWFFIRYADPDWHLRLRFHGPPERLHGEVLPTLQAALLPLLGDGRLRRWQLDTYEREVERYGGPEGITLAERFFHADSEAVLAMMAMLEPGDAGLEERWRLTLRGIDALLTDFGFDLDLKSALFKQMPKSLAEMGRLNTNLRSELSDKFRREREGLEELLDPAHDPDSPLSPGFDILLQRSQRVAPIVAGLKTCLKSGQLLVSLGDFAMSCVHMHANRLLRSAHREQELVIHEFLSRLYKSRAARLAAARH